VCEHARLNPRYFYENFADLDELIVAVYDRVVEEMTSAVLAALVAAANDGPREQSRDAIDSNARFVDEDRRRGRVMYVEALGNEMLNRRRYETGLALVELVEKDAAARYGPLGEGEHIGRHAAAILVGGFSVLLVALLDGRIDVSREQLVDDATALFLAL